MTGSGPLKVGLVQLNVGDDPIANLSRTIPLIRRAASGRARLVLTPEATNILSPDRRRQAAVLHVQSEDPTLSALRAEARAAGIWLLIGSLALKSGEDDRFVNRSFLIDPEGEIAASYDKLHMFDVTISETEQYRESAAYRPGDGAVLAPAAEGVPVGMTICYDLRFPHLYRQLAQAGAEILTVPAAFSPVTGAAHWEPLLRARAIECGAFVLAPAQCGRHRACEGKERSTHGHSMAIAPWGEVLADAGEDPGVTLVDIDLAEVARARARVSSLDHDRAFGAPS